MDHTYMRLIGVTVRFVRNAKGVDFNQRRRLAAATATNAMPSSHRYPNECTMQL